ncbi:hypothetical protein B0H67DRAFT_566874 [Lasiosphaeris hirsuta]|uniref:F-box domain-containing protein n=1 Tax=Lasiosphaeris hirsuta TaxID=260670 RepID=A0AA40BDG1_9PEZI|nr:hypothetical protein B0H67DRAFT_566874 [Lasiosphaeris hirsuta]
MAWQSKQQLPLRQKMPTRHLLQACIGALPAEILYMIMDHYLPLESIVALALTCRAFYSGYFPSPANQPLRNSYEAETLLCWFQQDRAQQLERATPGGIFCYDCNRVESLSHRNPCLLPPLDGRMGRAILEYQSPYFISYTRARLVMDRHFDKSAHGLALQDLETTHSYESVAHGVTITGSRRASIINDKLYLHGNTVVHRNHTGSESSVRAFIDHHAGSLVCRHLNTPITKRKHKTNRDGIDCTRSVAELAADRDTGAPFRRGRGRGGIHSCDICHTDYRANVDWDQSRGGWVITIDRWLRLGRCRSPLDPEWHTLAAPRPHDAHAKLMRQYGCAAGMVYNEWMREEVGVSVRAEASFVGLFGLPCWACVGAPTRRVCGWRLGRRKVTDWELKYGVNPPSPEYAGRRETKGIK